MTEGKSFVEILQDVPLVSAFELFKDGLEWNFVGFFERTVFAAKMPAHFQALVEHPVKCSWQDFFFNHEVISVFKLGEKVLVLDCNGIFHQICLTIKDEDTADLFDDPACEDDGGPVRQIFHTDSGVVLASVLISPRHLVILTFSPTEFTLALRLLSAESFDVEQSITIMKNVLCKPQNALLTFVDSDGIEKEFVSNWFPHFNPKEIVLGYAFVFNCGESACCVQLGFENLRLGFFFSWPSPCIYVSFRRQVIRGEETLCSSLLLSFEDGAVVKLSLSGGEILQFSLSKMRTACLVDNQFVCSDYSDCQATCLDPVEDPRVLPLKGVISFHTLSDVPGYALALTNFGGLYLVNPNVRHDVAKSVIPEVSSFQETVNNINYLEELNAKVMERDRAIKCLATAVNAKNFRFNVDVQVVMIIGSTHSFRVTAEILSVDQSCTRFNANDWHVVFSLSAKPEDNIVHVQRLPSDFSNDEPLEFFVNLRLEDDCLRDFIVEVKLISFGGIGKYRPTLVLGKLNLNVLNFLEPEQSLSVYAASSITEPSYESLLLCKDQSRLGIRDADHKITIEVPLNEPMEKAEFVEKLLAKSQALWRSREWTEVCANSSFNVVVSGQKISITLEERKAVVSSDNLTLATQMKFALLKLFKKTTPLKLNEQTLIETENLLKNLEIMEFSSEGLNVANLYELFKRKQKFINDAVTGTTSILPT